MPITALDLTLRRVFVAFWILQQSAVNKQAIQNSEHFILVYFTYLNTIIISIPISSNVLHYHSQPTPHYL